MNKAAIIRSFLYSISQITGGLLLHPYQTMQSLTREKVFVWMSFLPVAVFIGAKVIWFFIVVPMVRFVFSCSSTHFFGCDLIPFFANWLLFFCVYWQILLLYLLFRFFSVFNARAI